MSAQLLSGNDVFVLCCRRLADMSIFARLEAVNFLYAVSQDISLKFQGAVSSKVQTRDAIGQNTPAFLAQIIT